MLNRPKFKEHFHVEIAPPKHVFLLSENKHFALHGRLYVLLAPLLDGHHSIDDMIQTLQGQASATEINYSLTLLERKGYITETDNTLPPETCAFWNLLDINPQIALHKLQNTKVSVTTFGNIPTEPFISTLNSQKIPVSDVGDLAIVLTDDYLHIGLDAFNQNALQTQTPWLLIKPIGAVIWIGPIFYPGKTGCWHCLAQRLSLNRQLESLLQDTKGITTPFPVSRSILPCTLHTGFNLAATEIIKWITGKNDQLLGTIITLDVVNLTLQRHRLVRRPQCPLCGDPKYLYQQHIQPLLLTSQTKQFTADGGHRTCSPEETVKRYDYHISPITGVIKRLFNPLPTSHDLIHIYLAEHSLSPADNDLNNWRQAVHLNSTGKGKTDQQAKASAFAEAIERYSGMYTGDEPRIRATYSQLGASAIHPYTCFHYSEYQYRIRQEWNQNHHVIHWIPEPFDETQEIDWTPVWSLTHQNVKYLPTAYCYFGYPLPETDEFCGADTNGNAAGNTIEEAILQGFMEVVERDAVALWWYNRVPRPMVQLDSFESPYLQNLLTYYKTLHRDFWVLDITSDLNIPTFAAISRRTNKQPEDILFGFGTHFDVNIALSRAVTEMNQIVFLSNGANPNSKATFSRQDMQTWCETATLENQPYLAPDSKATAKVYQDYTQCWSKDCLEDVKRCVDIAAQQGLETLVLNQTRPDIAMSVVKVVVPGLRHFWAQFAPGRLYDVPVKLGWLKAPLNEAQLNPIPMFL
ncbi:TOMM precursor leader peptide-binding protein [Coleofasciculus sp. G2-EDA-02]|uniref:TOMM precursor leader peptide-binding protein n=1 Tax=Coleofasciculus sp. G2-EDA-02 TaxID=3069529 RepID=UPI0032FD74A9